MNNKIVTLWMQWLLFLVEGAFLEILMNYSLIFLLDDTLLFLNLIWVLDVLLLTCFSTIQER